ncbi:MAG: ATP-binding protein [Bacillota bacterium]|nr:ATP-binding protein [Bacillota bacterium]NPV44842.1 GHKL domain-containing protein [Bacillota bacterium]
MIKNRSLFIINTILVQILLIFIVNQQIAVIEDINIFKQYSPLLNLLVIILGIFSVFSITEVEKNASRAAEADLIKSHLDQIGMLVESLNKSRHEYAGHIQTIQSMLNLGKADKAIEYIEGIAERYWPCDEMVYVDHPALTALLNSKKTAAELKGVKFAFCAKCDLKNIPVKPWDLYSLVGNLLDNAFEAVVCNQGPKRVGLEIKHEQGNYVIYVHSNGPRIPDKLKEEIFNPGFTTKGSCASGYGLYFVKKLVEEYDGNIEVISGDKTTFIICLPDRDEVKSDRGYFRELRAGYALEPEK